MEAPRSGRIHHLSSLGAGWGREIGIGSTATGTPSPAAF
jgi:hypothetical protein